MRARAACVDVRSDATACEANCIDVRRSTRSASCHIRPAASSHQDVDEAAARRNGGRLVRADCAFLLRRPTGATGLRVISRFGRVRRTRRLGPRIDRRRRRVLVDRLCTVIGIAVGDEAQTCGDLARHDLLIGAAEAMARAVRRRLRRRRGPGDESWDAFNTHESQRAHAVPPRRFFPPADKSSLLTRSAANHGGEHAAATAF
jgi:hypothetical protein